MKNKTLIIILISAAALAVLLVILKIVSSSKYNASVSSSAATRIEKASKEEKELFDLAKKYEESGDLLNARETYGIIVEKFSGSNNVQKAQEALENINIRILFSSIPTADSVSYEVQKGDTLAKIAKKFKTTQEIILKANNLKSANVVPLGRKLKVHNKKFNIAVDKSQNILTLTSEGKIVKTYRVSTGLNNCTPVGTFKIVNKIIDPPWYTTGGVVPPDNPKNILGSRWLGLSAQGYGIHGTTEPQSIGKQVTSGCVRMKNSEVEELYAIVPEDTEVVIVD